MITCSAHDCENKVKNHYWGKVKAEHWFFQKDGTAFCPDHVPAWVVVWRDKIKS